MKKIIHIIPLLLIAVSLFSGCSDDEKERATAVTLKEAQIVSAENLMAIMLKDNETLQVTPFFMPADVPIKIASYSNSTPDIYDITADGLITPKVIEGDGELTVSTTDGSNLSTTYVVRITDHIIRPTSITVHEDFEEITLALDPPGETANLGANVTVLPANADNKAVIYSSGNNAVATVDEKGIVKPVGIGETTVTIVPVDNRKEISKEVKVIVIPELQKVEAINIAPEAQTLNLQSGQTYNLSSRVTVLPDDAFNKAVSYSSSDEGVVKVDGTGFITAGYKGTAQITVTARDGSGVQTTCEVNVTGDYNRSSWSVSVTPLVALPTAVDGSIGANDPKYLIDGADFVPGKQSCLGVFKPGRAGNPSELEGQTVYFVIDMKTQNEFSYFRLRHRQDMSYDRLRVWKATFYGSNDGTNFEKIIPDTANGGIEHTDGQIDTNPYSEQYRDVEIPLGKNFNYRYLKMTYDDWDKDQGGQMQIAEFFIGSN